MYEIFGKLSLARDKGGITFIELMVVLLVFTVVLSASLAFAGMVGHVTGTGADISVNTGFVPTHVSVIDNTTGYQMDWYAGMPNDTAFVFTNATDGTSRAVALNNGVTPRAAVVNATTGQVTTQAGFDIGAQTSVNVNGHELIYDAH